MINLVQGDCLENMKEIPDGSVDMVLADPPYGTSTRKMRKAEFSDLIECIYSVGAERDVQWSADTSIDWDSYKEARAA
jgi:DNA modification methylase